MKEGFLMKAKKHLTTTKRIVISAMAAVCALSSVAAISASAVEKVSTGDVYMMGYRLYGSVTAYPTSAQGFTYCERNSTNVGKSARTFFAYYDNKGYFQEEKAGDPDFQYPSGTSMSITAKPKTSSDVRNYIGAMTISRVYFKDQHQYKWTSEGTDNELRLGYYKR